MKSKSAQVTVFIIIAIVLIVAVILFLVLRGGEKSPLENLSVDLQPPYNAFLGCLSDETELGIRIMESQGGYIDLPKFEAGSAYMPFSNYLDFAGTNVPYWYYVSGNNIQKEQVPTKDTMEKQLAEFIGERITKCNLDSYLDEGYDVWFGSPRVETSIGDDSVDVILNMDFGVSNLGENQVVKLHKMEVDSYLGKLYDSAVDVYNQEQSELFLENYGVDIMNAYAPVDGVDISCGPKVWDAEKVFGDLADGIEANTMALKNNGDSDDYFNVDLGVGENVKFLNSVNWSSAYEVNPSDGRMLVSNPVGNQPGLGIMGFCYVDYHYVYNIRYPVLVQISKNNEVFQFPVAVVILGNKAREPLTTTAIEREITDFCDYKNTPMKIEVLDSNSEGVDAEISYECSGTTCYIGNAKNGELVGNFPQCANGRVIASSEGYREASSRVSTTNSGSATIFIDKYYSLPIEVLVDGKDYSGDAIVSFSSNESGVTVMYPQTKEIKLAKGEYNVTVYVYSNSSIDLGESVTQNCVEVPKGGLGGLIGLKEKKCFDVEFPEQIISRALSAGGSARVFVLDSMLANSNKIVVNVEGLPEPNSLEQLQENYVLFEDSFAEVDFE